MEQSGDLGKGKFLVFSGQLSYLGDTEPHEYIPFSILPFAGFEKPLVDLGPFAVTQTFQSLAYF